MNHVLESDKKQTNKAKLAKHTHTHTHLHTRVQQWNLPSLPDKVVDKKEEIKKKETLFHIS